MGMRKEMRLRLALSIRVSGENADGEPFEQNCTTVDLTMTGLRVEGLTQPLRQGAMVCVGYGIKSAPARVMWTGRAGGASQGHAGLQVIGGWNNLWGRALPRIPGDGFPNGANKTKPESESKPDVPILQDLSLSPGVRIMRCLSRSPGVPIMHACPVNRKCNRCRTAGCKAGTKGAIR